MEIHKPKPIHNMRDFLKEVGTIVLGVCIALAAEQTVEWVHWRKQVAEARGSIASELAINMRFGIEQLRHARCVDNRLGQLAQILDAASRTGMLPPVGDIGSPPRRPWVDGAWNSIVASQVATHFPRQELAELALIYQHMPTQQALSLEELGAWSSVNGMVGPGRRLDPASEAELRKAIGVARYTNRLLTMSSGNMMSQTYTQNLPFSDGDRRSIARFTNAPLGSICGPISGKVPESYGQAPLADRFSAAVYEFQKHPPYRPFNTP